MTNDLMAANKELDSNNQQAKSAGKLFTSRQERIKVNDKAKKTIDLGENTKKAEDVLLLAAASTPALSNAFKRRHNTIDAGRALNGTALSNDDHEQGGHETISHNNRN